MSISISPNQPLKACSYTTYLSVLRSMVALPTGISFRRSGLEKDMVKPCFLFAFLSPDLSPHADFLSFGLIKKLDIILFDDLELFDFLLFWKRGLKINAIFYFDTNAIVLGKE